MDIQAHNPSKRIHLIDEIRGGDILLVVIFHTFYTVGYILDIPLGMTAYLFFQPAQALFAGIFVFLCGFSSRLSHSNVRRGLMLAGVAAGITLVLALVEWWGWMDERIWFGILHLMAVCILLYAVLRPVISRINPWIGLAVCAVLFALTWKVMPERNTTRAVGFPGVLSVPIPSVMTNNVWLYPLGLGAVPKGGASDYFPLIPWGFCFFGGTFAGIWAQKDKLPRWMYPSRVPALGWLGRRTLVIYVLHQPIILLLGLGIEWVARLFK